MKIRKSEIAGIIGCGILAAGEAANMRALAIARKNGYISRWERAIAAGASLVGSVVLMETITDGIGAWQKFEDTVNSY